MIQEINKMIMVGNSAYYANTNLMKSMLLSYATKLKLYATLIRPVLTYRFKQSLDAYTCHYKCFKDNWIENN